MIRYVGGFARAGSITSNQYFEAKPDPLAPFAHHVQHLVQVPVESARILSIDLLGMNVSIM